MMVSNDAGPTGSRSLRACALLCALAVLPLGLVHAQDYEAVGKRLRAAVEAGELSGEQARIMLDTLRKADGGEEDRDAQNAKAHLIEVRKHLGAAVEAGEISEEDAKKKLAEVEKAIDEKLAAARKIREDFERQGAKIRSDIAQGKYTEEEGRAKMAAARKKVAKRMEQQAKQEFERATIEIKAAVDAGKISAEDARIRLGEMRKMMAQRHGKARPDWESIKNRIEGAVERGDLTREEADAKYRELKK